MPRPAAMLFLGATLAVAALTGRAAAQPSPPPASLIQNGNFQTGAFTGWTLNAGFTNVLSAPYGAYQPVTGATYAILGPVGADGTLSQTFADTAGATLDVSFYLASDGQLANDFSARVNNQLLLALSSIPAQAWTHYSFDVLATGSDTLSFAFRDDPGYLALANISVTPTSVPEPASWAVLLAGLAGSSSFLKKRTKKLLSSGRGVTL